MDSILSEKYPRAFSYTKLADASVAEFLSMENLQTGFHLPLSTLALQEVRDMQEQTALVNPDIADVDRSITDENSELR